MDFPGNSHTSRIVQPEKSEETPEPEKIKKVVTGKVTTRKKPLGARLKEMFVSDGGSFVDYLVESVVIPTIKELVITTITQTATGFQQGIEQRLFGEVRSRPTTIINRPGGSSGPVAYNRYSAGHSVQTRNGTPVYQAPRRRSNAIEDVIFQTRNDADAVLETLDCLIDDQKFCTVNDYYDLVGIRTQSTDADWGWYDLGRARVNQLAKDQFLISMPRPREIEIR